LRRPIRSLLGLMAALTATVIATGGMSNGTARAANMVTAADPPPGIYEVWGNSSDVASLPYVHGGQVIVQWKDVETARGRFDWSSLGSQLAAYQKIGKPATVQVNADTKPAWLWNYIAYCGTTSGQEIPQYWDPLYLTIQQEMISSLATYLKGSGYAATIALVRGNPNAIGTELTLVPSGYSCRKATNGHIYGVAWSKTLMFAYYQSVMGLYRTNLAPSIHYALRAQTFTTSTAPLDWLGTNDAWLMGTGSNIDPNPTRDIFDALSEDWARPGKTEAYWEPFQNTNANNLVSWNYWRILLELQKGVSYIAVYGKDIRNGSNPEWRAAFDFANRYAADSASPGQAPGAWVALKLGSGRLAGNFGWFMTQVAPETTSTAVDSNNGSNMIGPATQRFGRFARRIDAGTSKDTMEFRLDPAFKATLGGSTCDIGVIYLDWGTSQFRVRWGTGTADSATVTKTGTGRWARFDADVPCSTFAGGLVNSSDITVAALGSNNSATFHMVQVTVDGR
jgi:hypothetical protein